MECQQSVEVEEIRQGTFYWRIERYTMERTSVRISPQFKIGTSNCCLRICGRNEACRTCRDHSIVYLVKSIDKAFDDKLIYELSLISGNKVFFLTKRNFFTTVSCIPLAIVNGYEVVSESKEFLIDDVITLRLSWHEADDFSVGEQDNQMLLKEKETIKCLKTLSRDFSNFYESKMDTDCVLRVGEEQFPVHRQVLAARSEVFSAMFHHDTSESRRGVVDIPDVDEAIMGDVLNYIYSGEIHGMTPDTAALMFIAADKYALIEMRDICLDFLKHNLTVQNACDAAVLAHMHGEMDLEKNIIVFIEENLVELEETDEWQNFSKSESTLANKLLRSALMSCRGKFTKLFSK